ncbi:cytochrome P450-like protein 21 [Sarcoptes scabiei]|uniref:Cytochrome P450-like protein 21 n=1 Tax=Sarcoptes scabiei TaxID=52283 RepID=A0A132AEH9_SARSC|nr:cytochrome P450-like protein 21 [Sarcoptes scabiei]
MLVEIFLSNSPISLTLLGSLLGLIFIYCWRKYREFQNVCKLIEKIPGPKVSSKLLGHLSLVWQTPNKNHYLQQIFNTFVGISKIFQQQNHGLMRFWIGPTQPIVVIFDAEHAEILLNSNVNIDKSREYDFAIPWLGLGLFTSTGEKWRVHRKMLTPAFHFRILESFIPIIQKQQTIMMKIIETKVRESNDRTIDDIKPLITNCALDIICEAAMGVQIEAQIDPESRYSKAVRKVLDLFTERFLSPWLWNDWIFSWSPTAKKQAETIDFLHRFTRTIIQRRKKEFNERLQASNGDLDDLIGNDNNDDGTNKRVLAFLDSLLMQNFKDPGSWTDEDIRSEVDTFMSAGQDTSSATVQFALQLIGHHPEVQTKIHEELDSIYGDQIDREIRFEDLRHMKYLERCIKETLRIYPPVLFIARNIREEIQIKEALIPKKTTCMILFYQLHRDPKYFPNPERYDPDRFSPQQMNGRHAFAFTPFSAGPRNCIGQRFAMQTVKALLASIFRKYRIKSLVPMDQVELAFGSTVGPKNKITIKFEPRFEF